MTSALRQCEQKGEQMSLLLTMGVVLTVAAFGRVMVLYLDSRAKYPESLAPYPAHTNLTLNHSTLHLRERPPCRQHARR